MAVNETIVTGRKFRKCIDAATKAWQRISFWTKSSDVEFEDGKNAETKLGAIDGITDSLENTSSRMAASAKAVSTLNNNLGGYSFGETADGKPGYRKPGADTVIPFSKAAGTLSFSIRQYSGYAKPTSDNYPRAIVDGNYTVTINLETLAVSISGSSTVKCHDWHSDTGVLEGTQKITTTINSIKINT